MARHVLTKAGPGRPKGSTNKLSKKGLMMLAREQGRAVPLTPLMFMLEVLGNPKNSFSRRSWAAEKAAPYVHRKMPIAVEGGDPTRPVILAAAQHLRSLSTEEFAQLQALSMKLITEKVVSDVTEEEDGS